MAHSSISIIIIYKEYFQSSWLIKLLNKNNDWSIFMRNQFHTSQEPTRDKYLIITAYNNNLLSSNMFCLGSWMAWLRIDS